MSKEDFVAYAIKRQEQRKEQKKIGERDVMSYTIDNLTRVKRKRKMYYAKAW